MIIELIGYAAAFCTTAAFLPQAVKVYQSRHTRDISLGMFVLLTIGVILWLVYGILIRSLPIIAANSVTLLLDIYILYMKLSLDGLK